MPMMQGRSPRLRRVLLAGGLVATLAAVYFAPEHQSPEQQATASGRGDGRRAAPPAAPQTRQESARESLQVVAFSRDLAQKISVVDLFEARVPPAVALKEVKPEPPKLPFSYVGRVEDGKVNKVVLMHSGQVYVIGEGEQLAGNTYRLDEIEGDRLVFNYLPLAAWQELNTGAAR